MGFLGSVSSSDIWTAVQMTVSVLFVFSIIVFIHELGHFIVARRCGVRVLVFSIGFGREIAGFYDRHGTRWKIAAVPLGGYVKFLGDENAASVPDAAAVAAMTEAERAQCFFHKPIAQRAAIVAAGPIANFILAIAIFAGVFVLYGKDVMEPRVDVVRPGSAAAISGFQPGDVVLSIDGRPIESFTDMKRIVAESADVTLDIIVDRGGTKVELHARPTLTEEKDLLGIVHRIGVLGVEHQPIDVKTKPVDPLSAVWLGAGETWDIVQRTLSYVYGVVRGHESPDQLSGPIGIVKVTAKVSTFGFAPLMRIAAILSVSIGLLNLFPIPLLDGGHLLFYAIEAIRGRPLSERAQEIGFRIGFALLAMLMLFATYNDLLRGLLRSPAS